MRNFGRFAARIDIAIAIANCSVCRSRHAGTASCVRDNKKKPPLVSGGQFKSALGMVYFSMGEP